MGHPEKPPSLDAAGKNTKILTGNGEESIQSVSTGGREGETKTKEIYTTLKGKARLMKNVSAMKDLDKPCIVMQV